MIIRDYNMLKRLGAIVAGATLIGAALSTPLSDVAKDLFKDDVVYGEAVYKINITTPPIKNQDSEELVKKWVEKKTDSKKVVYAPNISVTDNIPATEGLNTSKNISIVGGPVVNEVYKTIHNKTKSIDYNNYTQIVNSLNKCIDAGFSDCDSELLESDLFRKLTENVHYTTEIDSLEENYECLRKLPGADTILWKSPFVKKDNVMLPSNYQKYFQVDNSVVEWYANRTKIKTITIPFNNNETATRNLLLFQEGKPLFKKYVSDKEQFDKGECWAQPSYFLTHGREGDCDEFATTIASILEFKGYDCIIALGKKGNGMHAEVETKIEDKIYVPIGDGTVLIPRAEYYKDSDFNPSGMFGKDLVYGQYDKNWYK